MTIEICMGSSCYVRGNRDLLAALEQFLETEGLSDRVALKGCLCTDCCGQGPNVIIDGEIYHEAAPGSIIDLLRSRFGAKTEG
ncbi:(2Fe-2S) ferredoxin domain-containing protein [Sediminispirochaeta bajacaliforniensis]|nr:(2Fe-2S) ferredoxin domain-containing protein [Sediminispirochaeta bajacaliforniensis]